MREGQPDFAAHHRHATKLLLALSFVACSSVDAPSPADASHGVSGGNAAVMSIAGAPGIGEGNGGTAADAMASNSIAGAAQNSRAGSTGVAGNAGDLGGTAGQDAAAGAGGLNAAGAGLGGAGGKAGAPSAGGSSATDPGSAGDGKVVVGPSYTKQTELTNRGAPVGKSFTFSMSSTNSQLFTGLDKTLNAPKTFNRRIDVYIPAKYQDGTAAPFLIIHDGPGALGNVSRALDNLAGATDPMKRLPAFVAIAVANGGGDGKGSERGLEYDTLSDRFARFIDKEVVPAVLQEPAIRKADPNFALTTDPEGRGTLGCSSGGAAALTMGWFRPDLFRRIVTYSGTFVDQQDDDAPEEQQFPWGAWEYHSGHSGMSLIAASEVKPLRVVINANSNDIGATAPESGHHNWVIANNQTATALQAKGYHYRYIVGQSAGHCDGRVQDATLADSLIWVWRGYP